MKNLFQLFSFCIFIYLLKIVCLRYCRSYVLDIKLIKTDIEIRFVVVELFIIQVWLELYSFGNSNFHFRILNKQYQFVLMGCSCSALMYNYLFWKGKIIYSHVIAINFSWNCKILEWKFIDMYISISFSLMFFIYKKKNEMKIWRQ